MKVSSHTPLGRVLTQSPRMALRRALVSLCTLLARVLTKLLYTPLRCALVRLNMLLWHALAIPHTPFGRVMILMRTLLSRVHFHAQILRVHRFLQLNLRPFM
jgi:hypothetical protein